MVLLSPVFAGQNSMDQIVEIIKVLGSPTVEQMNQMNPSYTSFNFPQIKPNSWERMFERYRYPLPGFIDLISNSIKYETNERLPAVDALFHPFFASLSNPDGRLPNGEEMPHIFDFTPVESGLRLFLCCELISSFVCF